MCDRELFVKVRVAPQNANHVQRNRIEFHSVAYSEHGDRHVHSEVKLVSHSHAPP